MCILLAINLHTFVDNNSLHLILSTLNIIIYSFLTKTLWGMYYHVHFTKEKHWCKETLNNFTEVTQLAKNKGRMWTQAVCCQSPCSYCVIYVFHFFGVFWYLYPCLSVSNRSVLIIPTKVSELSLLCGSVIYSFIVLNSWSLYLLDPFFLLSVNNTPFVFYVFTSNSTLCDIKLL